MSERALLVLEDGAVFPGVAWAARGATTGEIVFNTGMTGYQETLTDPSYHRQIVVMTAPHIGNTGINDEDAESSRIWVAGYVVRDPSRIASSWRARGTLPEQLAGEGIVGIAEVDTRALTLHLRSQGVMRAGIFSGDALTEPDGRERPVAALVEQVRQTPPMKGADLAGEVSTPEPYVVPEQGEHKATCVAVDLGIKGMTPQYLAQRGVRVHVVGNKTPFEQIKALKPDGVFFSNGPGDPAAATSEVALLRQVLDAQIPFFGICYGNQLLGRALGFGTYKLAFGHRGMNQPVMDLSTGKVEVTSHNHGFAVQMPIGQVVAAPYNERAYGRVQVSHIGLNDRVVEGIECLDIPAFSVQYHPEAAAGPHDSVYLFDRFLELMQRGLE